MLLKCKVCFLGDQRVGKTSLLIRHIDGSFTEDYQGTLGADFLVSKKKIGDLYSPGDLGLACDQAEEKEFLQSVVDVYIWDLGGQHAFDSLRGQYLTGANAAIVVFDIENPQSFENLNRWVNQVKSATDDIPFVVVGNKIDLKPWSNDFKEKADRFCRESGAGTYFFTSAKTGEGVGEMFDYILTEIVFTKDLLRELFTSS
ncbi:MAG: Rab family GTPase [Promethearchaeota archaeon]